MSELHTPVLDSFKLTDFLQMWFRPEEVSKSSAVSVLLGICPEEPREPFRPYTSMHAKHNHINVCLPLLTIPANKNPSTHFSVQQKNNHFDKCQREKERRLQLVTRMQEETLSSGSLTLNPWVLPHPSPYPWPPSMQTQRIKVLLCRDSFALQCCEVF